MYLSPFQLMIFKLVIDIWVISEHNYSNPNVNDLNWNTSEWFFDYFYSSLVQRMCRFKYYFSVATSYFLLLGFKDIIFVNKFTLTRFSTSLLGSIKISDVLRFISGSPSIPALGFGTQIEITFRHCLDTSCRCLPNTSTCALVFHLPNHCSDGSQMKKMMTTAIRGGYGFYSAWTIVVAISPVM